VCNAIGKRETTMSDKQLEKKVDRIEEKVDRTALITDMLAKLKTASDRWAEVCRVYDGAWKAAFDTHAGVLGKVEKIKEERVKAAADRLKTCLDLACVFLPIIGGPAAVALAPILTARGKLLANTIERKAQAAWSAFATRRPIVSQVVKEIGTRSAEAAQGAAAKIQEDVIEKLSPKYVVERALTENTNPLDAFIDNNNLTRGAMNKWVETCSDWNVKGGWERQLVPVAHDLFIHHPWIREAPPEQSTQALRAPLTFFIEMALWLRWARTLDEGYWRKVHDWYVNEYKGATRDSKSVKVRNYRSWVVDALDFRVLWVHLKWQYALKHKSWKFYDLNFDEMTLLDPESGGLGGFAERQTIDLYTMIRRAKHHRINGVLAELLPNAKIDPHLLNELAKM
jgi:hypothetical protein